MSAATSAGAIPSVPPWNRGSARLTTRAASASSKAVSGDSPSRREASNRRCTILRSNVRGHSDFGAAGVRIA